MAENRRKHVGKPKVLEKKVGKNSLGSRGERDKPGFVPEINRVDVKGKGGSFQKGDRRK